MNPASPSTAPLLVPLQLEALVIEGEVSPDTGEMFLARHTAARGASLRWKPTRANYGPALRNLLDPKLNPFHGAVPEAGGRLALRESERPKGGDRGVHLRWIVPAGLRKALGNNSLHFPALPDQWLILRMARRAASPRDVELKAWVVDGSAYPGDAASASLPIATPGREPSAGPELTAQPVGIAVPLDAFDAARHAQMPRTTLTAMGTPWTGSPTFATSLAENRNILSWHDTLADLRDAQGRLALACVSYALVGWYFSASADPLAALPRVLKDAAGQPADLAAVLGHLGWSLAGDADAAPGPCLFHGQVAHINFWDGARYRGPLLGTPQSPPAHAGLSPQEERVAVGLGASVPAALSALVSDQWWSDEVDPENRPKWAVLEGHLLGAADPAGLDAGERRRLDHPLGFKALDAGMRHSFVQNGNAADNSPVLAPAQAQELERLNARQSALNDAVRALAARGHGLRTLWRERVIAVRLGTLRPAGRPEVLAALEADLGAFGQAVEAARATAVRLAADVDALRAGLPQGWGLSASAEPRFWAAADPVVMLAGLPGANRPTQPAPLPCRRPADLFANVPAAGGRAGFPQAALAALAGTIAEKRLPLAGHLAALLGEAARMEQAVASEAFARTTPFAGQGDWQDWKEALQARFRSGTPGRSMVLLGGSGREVLPEMLVAVWGQQPWSPLYIDWDLVWHASPGGLKDWTFATGQHPLHYDYRQPAHVPAARRDTPARVRGRSLLAPMDGRFVTGALEAAIAESRLNNGDFAALTRMPLVGQELSGLTATVRRLNAQALMPAPDAALPWLTPLADGRLQAATAALVELAAGLRIALPASPPPLTASEKAQAAPLDAGWFRIEHLWVVDDFGQWAEPVSRPETRVQPHPRSRLRLGAEADDTQCGPFALPPRLVDGARLDVRFAGPSSPLRGWLYVNRLDNALVVCSGEGQLLGELALLPGRPGPRVAWRSLAAPGPVTLAGIADPVLAHLAGWLADATRGGERLAGMMLAIESALPTIRRREAAPEHLLVGRPLAVVSARARLQSVRGAAGETSGGSLQLPLRIGNRRSPQDGLVAHAQGLSFGAVAPLDVTEPPLASFAEASDLVLVMDPMASVEFACGVLPAKTVNLPPDEVRAALARLEIGFGVGPVLCRGGLPILPPPASHGGRWELRAADGASVPVTALSADPRFDGSIPSAMEGRLILRRPERPANATREA
ncbi:hypothetical protein [Ancylobacter sp.]|uniref:hypothetical protein n=1 Tax=Ancylobacter sp. TaxID=1872567 RepID=UPI003D101517